MDFSISNQERIDLKRLVQQTPECEDNTERIRKLKHSTKIQNDVNKFWKFKKENMKMYQENIGQFEIEAQAVADFLYLNYTDLFRRLIKDELNLGILAKFLHVLKAIEDGKVDQHEGSVLIGKILKEMYLDSAVRHGENLDKKYAAESGEENMPKNTGQTISWREYKQSKN